MQLLEMARERYLAGEAGNAREFEDPATGGVEANEANNLELLAAGHVRQDCSVPVGTHAEELEIGQRLMEFYIC